MSTNNQETCDRCGHVHLAETCGFEVREVVRTGGILDGCPRRAKQSVCLCNRRLLESRGPLMVNNANDTVNYGAGWEPRTPPTAGLPGASQPLDLEHLRSLAEKATPGPWTVVSDLPTYAVAAGRDFRIVPSENQNNERTYGRGIRGGTTNENASFIAAFNPQTALALIAETEWLRAENERHAATIARVEQECADCEEFATFSDGGAERYQAEGRDDLATIAQTRANSYRVVAAAFRATLVAPPAQDAPRTAEVAAGATDARTALRTENDDG